MTLGAFALVVLAVICWPGRSVGPGVAGDSDGWTRPRVPVSPRRRARPTADLEDLARVADLLAMTLRSGATPVAAVGVVAQQAGAPWAAVLGEVHDRLGVGAPVGPVWHEHARERPELASLAGSWALSEDLGVALAPSMATSARVLRDRVTARRRLEASTAGARATMRMLTLLPLAGVFAGLAFGLAPWEVYGHSPVTVASGLVGVALTGIGWLVCRWVLARALAPQVHR